MTPTEFETTVAQMPTYVIVVEVTKKFDALPGSERLIGQRFIILDPNQCKGPYAVLTPITGAKVLEGGTTYPVKGIKFLGYTRLFNDSLERAFYKNLRVSEEYMDQP